MKLGKCAWLAVVPAVLAGCPNKEDDTPPPAATVPVATVAPATTTTTTTVQEMKPEGAPKLGVTPRVKAEVDGRPDGTTGTSVAVPGALASLQAPTGWTVTKGDVTTAASADKKASFSAAAVGAEGAQGKLAAATAPLGVTNCEWAAPEAVTIGKSKLAGTAADGLCTRGTAQVHAAYVSPTAEKLLVVGVWDADGDANGLFGGMRAIAKAGGGGDSSGIGACCNALRGNAKVAPPEQQGALLMAAGICDAARSNPDARAALSQIRQALRGANMPGSCQ